MTSMEDICQKSLCSPPDVKRLNGYILKVSTTLSQYNGVKMQARSCWI